MVVSLGPGKFYGTSLPRPRFYTDVVFNDPRVDPPVPVTDPLMSWAQEAHWTMGGLSFNRLRLQGKIEGNVNRLRTQLETQSKSKAHSPLPQSRPSLRGSKRPAPDSPSPPPAPVATKRRRLMAVINEEEEEEEDVRVRVKAAKRGVRRRLVKKLGDDFDRVASENEGSDASDRAASNAGPLAGSGGGYGSDSMAARTTRRSRRLVKGGEAVMMKAVDDDDEAKKRSDPKGKKSSKSGEGGKSPNGLRTSPRLAKSRPN